MIYFIQSGDFGPIAIGHSSDVNKRMTTLQASSSENLRLIGVIHGEVEQKKMLHQVFNSYRKNGEWFEPCIPLIDYIEKNAKKPNQHQLIKFTFENVPDEVIEFKPGVTLQQAIEEVEIAIIKRALIEHEGKQVKAGKSIGISKSLMQYKLKKYKSRLDNVFVNRNLDSFDFRKKD